MDTRRELVNAWTAWERACLVISRKGEKAAKRNRVYKPPPRALEKETHALVDALCKQAGIDHARLHDRIADGRRAGLSVEQAVAAATR